MTIIISYLYAKNQKFIATSSKPINTMELIRTVTTTNTLTPSATITSITKDTSIRTPLSIQMPTYTPAPETKTKLIINWITYVNIDHHFRIQYPDSYLPKDSSLVLRSQDIVTLLSLHNPENDAWIELYYDPHEFSLEYLIGFAPTGSSDAPDAQIIGLNTFYYYGLGGGGVAYPDQYFMNLSGNVLIFIFDGPYLNAQTPSQEAKIVEKQMLSTLQIYN
jgi:hypothetical protein